MEASGGVAKLNCPATMNTFCERLSLSGHVSALAWFDRGINPIKPNGIKASGHPIQSTEHSINRPNNRLEPTAAVPFTRGAPRLKTCRYTGY